MKTKKTTSNLDQRDFHIAVDLIEEVLKRKALDAAALCLAGKSYLGLFVYYRSSFIQNYFAHIQQEFDSNLLITRAIDYFSQSAEQQYGLAHHYLGHLYQKGIGVEESASQALFHYKKAVACGFLLSKQRIGYFSQKGLGLPKDMAQAVQAYEEVIQSSLLSKEQRKVVAFAFGKTAQPIRNSLSKNNSEHIPEYAGTLVGNTLAQLTKQIENGVIASLTNLALLYLEGIEVSQDKVKAYEYFSEARKLGCPNAQMSLGTLYQQGSGVKQDYARAAQLYKEAADQGHVDAQLSLGFLYYNGLGVIRDEPKAKIYFELAAAAGNTEGQVWLGFCYYKGVGTDIDYKKALYFYQKAADQNHVIGLKNLGALYYQGLGVEEDRDKARLLWDKAEDIQRI